MNNAAMPYLTEMQSNARHHERLGYIIDGAVIE
jgi:hypothetical protein